MRRSFFSGEVWYARITYDGGKTYQKITTKKRDLDAAEQVALRLFYEGRGIAKFGLKVTKATIASLADDMLAEKARRVAATNRGALRAPNFSGEGSNFEPDLRQTSARPGHDQAVERLRDASAGHRSTQARWVGQKEWRAAQNSRAAPLSRSATPCAPPYGWPWNES